MTRSSRDPTTTKSVLTSLGVASCVRQCSVTAQMIAIASANLPTVAQTQSVAIVTSPCWCCALPACRGTCRVASQLRTPDVSRFRSVVPSRPTYPQYGFALCATALRVAHASALVTTLRQRQRERRRRVRRHVGHELHCRRPGPQARRCPHTSTTSTARSASSANQEMQNTSSMQRRLNSPTPSLTSRPKRSTR